MHFGFRLARASLGRSLERRRSWKGSGCTSQRLLDSPLERRPWQTLSLSLSLSRLSVWVFTRRQACSSLLFFQCIQRKFGADARPPAQQGYMLSFDGGHELSIPRKKLLDSAEMGSTL